MCVKFCAVLVLYALICTVKFHSFEIKFNFKKMTGASLVLHVPCISASSGSQQLHQTFRIIFVLFCWSAGLQYWVLVLVLDLYLSTIFKYLYLYWYLELKYWYLYLYLRHGYWYWYLTQTYFSEMQQQMNNVIVMCRLSFRQFVSKNAEQITDLCVVVVGVLATTLLGSG